MVSMTQPPPPPPPQYGAPQAQQPMNPQDEKMWSILIHLSGILLSFIGPLIGYLVLKDRGPFIRFHTAQALNLQITLAIAYIAGTILSLIVIGIFVLIAAGIIGLVFMIMAAVKANNGEFWKIPLTIQFVK
jgi:uncharacterized protein